MSIKIYNTVQGLIAESDGNMFLLKNIIWDSIIANEQAFAIIQREIAKASPTPGLTWDQAGLLPPVGQQEVWAAGVTYFRSRDARMEESKTAGGGSFYDRVYLAPRPELFFKSPGYRVVGHRQPVRIRADSKWNVPEPEWTLVIASSGKIIGYTVGNDMSSRDIEGENPLYLPQAKSYDGACALGPGVLLAPEPLPKTTRIILNITRSGQAVFDGTTSLAEIKRTPEELAGYLFRETTFTHGALLMTGTGIIPDNSFTLHPGDVISITIDGIGTLVNPVAQPR